MFSSTICQRCSRYGTRNETDFAACFDGFNWNSACSGRGSAGRNPFKILVSLLALGALRELQNGIARSEGYGGARLVGAVAYVCVIWAVWNGISRGWALRYSSCAAAFVRFLLRFARAHFARVAVDVTVLHALRRLIRAAAAAVGMGKRALVLADVAERVGQRHARLLRGRALGRRKMSSLSPGKTWEGFAGGFAGALLVSAVAGAFWKVPFVDALTLGALIGVAAPLGDLVESFLKRELGLKDLGSLFPGHGGVLDRCDSILFAGLATSIWLKLL
jgi:phosphatidate cytidylyltransferase